jgi:hypothetical protein
VFFPNLAADSEMIQWVRDDALDPTWQPSGMSPGTFVSMKHLSKLDLHVVDLDHGVKKHTWESAPNDFEFTCNLSVESDEMFKQSFANALGTIQENLKDSVLRDSVETILIKAYPDSCVLSFYNSTDDATSSEVVASDLFEMFE